MSERAPPAHLLAGALCAGLAASLVARATGVILAVAAGALAVLAVPARRSRAALLAAALLVAGTWWGSVRLAALDESVLEEEIGRAGLARAEVIGPSRTSEFATRLPVRVLRFGRTTMRERAQLVLPRGRAPPQGALIELVATVARPQGPQEDGGFDEAAYLRRQGIHVVVRADTYRVVGRRGGIGAVADRLRAGVLRSLAAAPEGDRRAVLAGVVLGEDGGLESDLRDSFRASGLYHLLAVSGQNVAYVVAGAILLAWTLGLPRRAGEVGALVAIAAYVLAVGWQPSVVRAGVAGTLASLAWLASRPRDRWYFLLAGAAVLLAWNPYSLLDPGFQLSFAAVAAIFLLVPRIERALEGYPVPRWLVGALAVSLACGLATAPVLFADFGAIPLYSILANALAAPVVAPLLGLALAASALHPFLPDAAAALTWVDGWLAAYLAFCARTVGGLPHAQATSATVLGLVGGALVLGALGLRAPSPAVRRAAVLAGVALALVVAWRGLPSRPAPPPEGLRLTVLDVGQGDAILLQVPEGAVLVDEGPPEADVADRLDGLGVDRLTALVLTHPERDHVGGAADVLERVPVEAILDPRIPAEGEDETRALAAARERGVPVLAARAGEEFRIGALRLRVLWPDRDPLAGGNANDSAIVLLASYGTVDVLLTADAEGAVTVPIRPPPAEILKVAHHGSDDPRLPELLELVRPRIAVVSVGSDNDYGHPTPATMAALAGAPGLAVYRTDEDGSVTIETDGARISVRED
ncbi:MAG TPA: DNA internalization-related competence protein ComEC/Rec2 [Gaiellaceae bacterium]|nr:DNA internalization-related competence protein ComEC/Rec2 [Gaiellaceae bacterium]